MEGCLGSQHRSEDWTYGKWSEDEDVKLKGVVQTLGDKVWVVIVPR
jgi:hypothetical protein